MALAWKTLRGLGVGVGPMNVWSGLDERTAR